MTISGQLGSIAVLKEQVSFNVTRISRLETDLVSAINTSSANLQLANEYGAHIVCSAFCVFAKLKGNWSRNFSKIPIQISNFLFLD